MSVKRFFTIVPVAFLSLSLLLGGVTPALAQVNTNTTLNQSVQDQINILMQLVVQLQALLLQLQNAQNNTSTQEQVIQGIAPQHTYVKLNSTVNGETGIDISSPLVGGSYDKSNPQTDVIEFRWKATNVPYDTKVRIVDERIGFFDYSGPIGGGTWEGEIPMGASTGLLKSDISRIGTNDAGEYRARIAVLDNQGRELSSSVWVQYTIIDSKNVEKSCSIETDKKVYSVGESIKVRWVTELSSPTLVYNTNVSGVLVQEYKNVSKASSREFIAQYPNGAKGYEISIFDVRGNKVCTANVAVERQSLGTKSCTIETDKDQYLVGEDIIVRWTSTGFVRPVLQDNNKAGGSFNVGKTGTRTFDTWSAYVHHYLLGDNYSGSEYDSRCEVKVPVVDKNTSQNLTISEVKLSLPSSISHTSLQGYTIPTQEVRVMVKNNEFGAKELTGQNFQYRGTLYEVRADGRNIKTPEVVSGKGAVPYANGFTEFVFTIDSALPFDGQNFEKKYKIKVEIDTENEVSESNDTDNARWSKEWVMDYSKG